MSKNFRQPLIRRVKILKYLQGEKKHIDDVAQHFRFGNADAVDTRTIRKDLEALRDGLEIFDTKIKISESRDGRANLYYESTVHPIFLALNTSELFALLLLLEERTEDLATGQEYQAIFDKIYGQTTDYARSIIDTKLKNPHQLHAVHNRLDEDSFHDNILYWLKSGRQILITYKTKKGEEITRNCRIVSYSFERGEVTFENLDKNIKVKRLFKNITIHGDEATYK